MRLFIGLVIFVVWMCVTATAVALVPERQQGRERSHPLASRRGAHSSLGVSRSPAATSTTTPRPEATTSTTHAPPTTTTTAGRVLLRGTTTTTQAAPLHATMYVPRFDGTCAQWVAAAGIVDTASTFQLIALESGCNPYIRNPRSGACGVPQALPCSKMPCALGDGYCQLRWMREYVEDRYGTFANALAFRIRAGWY